MSEDDGAQDDAPRGKAGRPGGPGLRGFARRMFRDDGAEGEEGRGDGRDLLGAVLETGDKAKTEVVRMVAREVRTYLEALELHKDLHHLITHYSLEVHASVSLKPLDGPQEPAGDPGVRVGLKKKPGAPADEPARKADEPAPSESSDPTGE